MATAPTGQVPTDGNGKLTGWLLGLGATVLAGAIGSLVATVNGDAAKVAALEQRATALEQSLGRIEGKIDKRWDRIERGK